MALNDSCRVKKDPSARKSIIAANAVPAIEVAAIRASHTAYIDQLKTGYEETIEGLQSAHDQQSKAMKAEHEQTIAALKAERADAEQKAAAPIQELAAAKTECERLREQVTALTGQVQNAKNAEQLQCNRIKEEENDRQADLRRELAESRAETETARKAEKQIAEQFDGFKRRALSRFNSQQTQLRTFWIQITFEGKSKAGRTRSKTYFGRYGGTLREAVAGLFTEVLDSRNPREYLFRRGGIDGPRCDLQQTLEQLEITDGTLVRFDERSAVVEL